MSEVYSPQSRGSMKENLSLKKKFTRKDNTNI